MENQTLAGFTLIELLIVIAIIGILAAVLIPNLLGARKKANDAAAQAVVRQTLTALAAVEVADKTSSLSGCTYAAPSVTVTAGAETASVNAPAPITGVVCANSATTYTATVTYDGGSSATLTATASK